MLDHSFIIQFIFKLEEFLFRDLFVQEFHGQPEQYLVLECFIGHVFIKDIFTVLEKALVYMHAGAVVFEDRFGHECCHLVMFAADIFNDIFVHHHLIAHLYQRCKPHIDFTLSAGGYLVMMDFNADSCIDQGIDYL